MLGQWKPRALAVLCALSVTIACGDGGSADGGPDDAGHPDAPASDALPRDAFFPPFDGGALVPHDGGGPLSCNETCDCPQGLACLGGECRTAGVGAVYCCTKAGCPSAEACLGPGDQPDRCPSFPDAGPDAGSRDAGRGFVGSECTLDTDCDLASGITCWPQNESPFLWGGYCTVEGCLPSCPGGSECISFGGAGGTTGCMQSCTEDVDCRLDAYCLTVPSSPIQICFPDCRDDIFDCAPRDGTSYCSGSTGRCEPTTMQSATAQVGDFCEDNRDCGSGEVCMGAFAWGLSAGVCTRVCAGLPEATACGGGETCQTFAGIGLCFRDCAGGACPDRPDAMCGRLDPIWPTPSCVPL